MNTACINIGFARITLSSIYDIITNIIKCAFIIILIAILFPDNIASDTILSIISSLL